MKKVLLAILAAGVILAPTANATVSADQPERVYFVMLDRFNNGDPANDLGGFATEKLAGYNPADNGFWHGGDFKGLTEKLSYIKSLGFTSVWVSPVVRNQAVAVDGGSSGYHGYWGLGFDQTDPHFGTMAEFKAMVQSAHDLGLKIILDIVINHTGDIIQLVGGNSYVSGADYAYRTCDGKKFDAVKTAGSTAFPALTKLCAKNSFPKQPFVYKAESTIKSPSWLNDPRVYHNRGDSTFSGESSQWGDFVGLDDLFTENPVVVAGLTKIWSDWIKETGIDGFRIDTARHVNEKFWKTFIPAVTKAARDMGKATFPIWGEAWETDPLNSAYWVVEGNVGGGLDFAFQERVQNFVTQARTNPLAALFNDDDYYTTPTSNVNTWGTFLGNHDMGRIGAVLNSRGNTPARVLRDDQLAHAMLFLLRGSPIVYYGDEFGLTGGNDKAARQDLFPTKVTSWQSEPRVGGSPIGTKSAFDTTNPLQTTIRQFNSLRASYPALGSGPQEVRFARDGLLVASRFDINQRREYLVAFNALDEENSTDIKTTTPGGWRLLAGEGSFADSTVSLPAHSWALFEAVDLLPKAAKPSIVLQSPNLKGLVTTRIELKAKVPGNDAARVEFFARSSGTWRSLGVDTARTFSNVPADSGWFRLYPLRSGFKSGTKVDFKAVVTTSDGQQATSAIKSVTITK